MKEFLGYIGFALMFVLIFKGCDNPVGRPMVGCNGIYYSTECKESK